MKNSPSSPFLSISHLQRLKQLDAKFTCHASTPVEVSGLAEMLACSERNVSKLMSTLMAKGCVLWQPGRGRGNKSSLTLLMTFEEALLAQLESQARAGHIDEAFRYAEQFERRSLFQDKLPLWLEPAQAQLSKQNTLAYLVPYSLPEWRPTDATSVSSIMLLEAVYDTLVQYDKQTGKIVPHLAHHFTYQDSQYRFRIRNDVLFHNGVKLEASHLKRCFCYQMLRSQNSKLLFRHVENIEVDGQWLIFNMQQFDPIFPHLLADIHSAVFFVDSNGEFSKPVGTGPYQLGSYQPNHWVLEKNRHYFSVGGLIEKANFWSTSAEEAVCCAHVQEISFSSEQNRDDSDKVEQDACNVFEFVYHSNMLSLEERTWLVAKTRQFAEQQNSISSPLANSVIPYHQDKGFHLFKSAMKKPSRPIVIVSSRKDSALFFKLIDFLQTLGVECDVHHQWEGDKLKARQVDIINQCYVFGNNTVFQYYRWLLTGNIHNYGLDAMSRHSLVSFMNSLMDDSSNADDFLDKLYRVEDWLIQNLHYVPLWRHHARYTTSQKLHGIETNSMGVMSLANLWLE